MILYDDDLITHPNTYSESQLEENISRLNKKIMLVTQKLSAAFCIRYILDMDIDNGSEDSYIYDYDYILYFQRHLTYHELKNAYIDINFYD